MTGAGSLMPKSMAIGVANVINPRPVAPEVSAFTSNTFLSVFICLSYWLNDESKVLGTALKAFII